MIGTRVDGKYELSKVLGQGAMGIVYRARHATTGREVALKLLHPGKALAPQALGRFQREALAMGTVADSVHAVQVLDAGVDSTTGSPYIVMELLSGEDIDALLSRLGPLPVPLSLRIAAQALTGLIPAHDKGIVHRDLKPSNLFLMRRAESEPVVKVLDFGIAKMRAEAEAEGGPVKGNLTATNSTLGSPAYMSPEQVRGAKTLDARSDLWSMGVVLYQLVSGALPFEADALSAMLLAIMNGVPVPLGARAPWAPPGVAGIIERAMQRDPAQRFASAREMREEIVRLLGGAPGSSVTATAAITDAMVAPLSAAEKSSRPSVVGGAVSVPGAAPRNAGAMGSGFGGVTAPMASLPGSVAPATAVSAMSPMSNVGAGSPTAGTQPISALPGSFAAGPPAASFAAPPQQGPQAAPAAAPFATPTQPAAHAAVAAPFAAPTQESARAVPAAQGGGNRIGLIVSGVGVTVVLAAAAFALILRSGSPAASGSAAGTGQTAIAISSTDAGGGGVPPVAPSPKASDGPDAGAGPAVAASDSARSPASTPPPGGNGRTPSAGTPGNSKTNADPFKGSRTGK